MNSNNEKEERIIDVNEAEEMIAPVRYDISSYGADYTVDSIVKRLNDNNIFIPPFQRDYVWNQAEASRLIESLLLGLPVPGIFLAKEQDSNKLYVIDGQQRLKSLQFFFNGFFNPHKEDKLKKIFKLIKVQERFENRTYNDLDDCDRVKLDDSIIHATIIKQESPANDNTSIYHVFERLNTGGRKLTSQEIRAAIYIGELNQLIYGLNEYGSWRELFGKKSIRLKDQELILRFIALFYDFDNYQKPLNEFLNKYNAKNRHPSERFQSEISELFKKTTDLIFDTFGKSAFRPDKVFNAAACEVFMVGFAKMLKNGVQINQAKAKEIIARLFNDLDFKDYVTRATSDENVITKRHELFEEYFRVL
ncbi:MAG: DUF262 domain-containing protein [Bacteroidales bacterium]|nr:DUF262 domain-containing protein [Bacteroidales bacterium]